MLLQDITLVERLLTLMERYQLNVLEVEGVKLMRSDWSTPQPLTPITDTLTDKQLLGLEEYDEQ